MYTELEEIFLRIITCDLDGNDYKEVLGPKSIPNKDSCYVYGQCWKSKNEIVFTYNEKNSTTWSVGVLDLLSNAISYITCIDTLDPYIIQWSPKYNEMVFVGKGDPGKGTQIWAVNVDDTKVRKLSDCFLARAPDLSPDEEKVIFSQLTNGPDDMYTIWVVDRDGSNYKQLLADDNYDLIEPVW